MNLLLLILIKTEQAAHPYQISGLYSKEPKYKPSGFSPALIFIQMYCVKDKADSPSTYDQWLRVRQEHLQHNMEQSHYTTDLYQQYRKHLGIVRYRILLEAQILVMPARVRRLLSLRRVSLVTPVLGAYKLSRKLNIDWLLKALILPPAYKSQIKDLDIVPA